MTSWLDTPSFTGSMWGAVDYPTCQTRAGRVARTTHAPPAPFDPTGWKTTQITDLLDADPNLAVIIHMLGIRTSDPTFPPGGLRDVANLTPYVRDQLDKWVAILRDLPRVVFARMWHEMNDRGNTYSVDTNAGNTQADYRAAWRTVHNYLLAAGVRDRVRLVWCQGGHLNRPTAATGWYPGDDAVDWIATDAYSTRTNGYPEFGAGLAPWYAAFSTHPKPLMLAEIGSDVIDPNRTTKINGLAAVLKTMPRIKSITWWDAANYEIVDQPAGYLAAYQRFVHRKYMNPVAA